MIQPSCRVSIVIKALIEEPYVAKAIESALSALENVGGEVILADSASTDRTVEVIKKYEPWLDYWHLSMRHEDASNKEVREFLATHATSYESERLRSDWLRVLGKRSDWQEFERQAKGYPASDLEVSCYRSIARLDRRSGRPV